jgi:hypothetical protein
LTKQRSRHMSPETLDEYLSTGALAAVTIPGTPAARLVIDPGNETLALEIAWDGEDPPDIRDYVHIDTTTRFDKGQNWSSVRIRGIGFFHEGHPLLCQVADLVQADGIVFSDAVVTALSVYHELLSAQTRMPDRAEIGLWGELFVLATLIESLGGEQALRCWLGGDANEERDFRFVDDDVEIKTTTAETRRHWISSITQLVPTLGRPLWLLSLQVTGAGGADGKRLPDLIELISARLQGKARADFEARIADTEYSPVQPKNSFRLLGLRSRPACYRVDDDFPRLTPALLPSAPPAANRIEEVSYTVRLDGLSPAPDCPEVVRGLTHPKEKP